MIPEDQKTDQHQQKETHLMNIGQLRQKRRKENHLLGTFVNAELLINMKCRFLHIWATLSITLHLDTLLSATKWLLMTETRTIQ